MNTLSKNFKFYFQLILIAFTLVIWVTIALSDTVIPNKNSTEKDTISFILSTGRASLNSPEDTDLARRRALEDALYLASIEGGAKINGYSAIDSGTKLTENFVVRPTTKILDYAITKEVIKETHYEVTIKAAIGSLDNKNCSNNNIFNLIAYKPIFNLSNESPAWLSPVLNELFVEIINDINNRQNIELFNSTDIELNSSLLKNINDDYDYTSLTLGRTRTEVGSFAYVPTIKMYVDKKSSALNNETFLIMEITSNLYEGFTYKKSSSKSHKISLKLSNRSPWRTVNILSKPSRELIVEALKKSIKKHVDSLLSDLDCQPLTADLKFENQIKKLKVNIGKKHGLSFNSIAFTRGTNTPWVIFKVDDLDNNNAILSPIDQRRDIKELDGKLVEFMEVL